MSQSSPVILAQLFEDTMIGMKKIANSTMFFYYVSLRCDEYAMNIYRQLKNSSEKHVDIFWASWSSPGIHRKIMLSSILF